VEQEMFEPFVSTKPSGTGLGLAISRTIAQNHGGQLQVQPGESGGACFTLRLPGLIGASAP
jgi:two-component system sensor kinase FixL